MSVVVAVHGHELSEAVTATVYPVAPEAGGEALAEGRE